MLASFREYPVLPGIFVSWSMFYEPLSSTYLIFADYIRNFMLSASSLVSLTDTEFTSSKLFCISRERELDFLLSLGCDFGLSNV